MNLAEKQQSVEELRERFGRAKVAILAESKGLSVPTVEALRRAVRAAGGEFKVAKNTLAKRAVENTDYDCLASEFQGPTGLVFGYDDPVSVTKELVKFTAEHANLQIRVAALDRQLLPAEAVKDLANLPPREVLLGMLLGLIQAPATQLVRLLQEPGARVARLVSQLKDRADKAA